MTQEEKELLLKDLSARLPYGVKIKLGDYDYQVCGYNSEKPLPLKIWYYYRNSSKSLIDVYLEDYHPYLRPMSSMTEEERKEYNEYLFHGASIGLMSNTETAYELIDWLNKKMFAYRTIDGKDMFELGIAIEVTEENNPYKD